jgi:uncharacterized protein (DUF1697 family)
MHTLRKLCGPLGLKNLETFIASGNLIFESRSNNPRALEKKIASHLQKALGFPVITFIRSEAEIAAIAAHDPFAGKTIKGARVFVGLLGCAPDADACRQVDTYQTPTQTFHVHGRELYWQCVPSMRMLSAGARLDKTLGPTTMRTVTTLRRLAARMAERR